MEYLVSRIKAGLWTFSKLVFNANRDLPFHDYHLFNWSTAFKENYVVGSGQLVGHGDQRKRFVSKSTLFYTTVDTTVWLNSTNNIGILILANTWYEFKSNIYQVTVFNATQGQYNFYAYFEGVMQDEAREPE